MSLSRRPLVYVQASFFAWGEGRRRVENVLLGVIRGRSPLPAADCYTAMHALINAIETAGRPAPAGMVELRDEYHSLAAIKDDRASGGQP